MNNPPAEEGVTKVSLVSEDTTGNIPPWDGIDGGVSVNDIPPGMMIVMQLRSAFLCIPTSVPPASDNIGGNAPCRNDPSSTVDQAEDSMVVHRTSDRTGTGTITVGGNYKDAPPWSSGSGWQARSENVENCV